MIRRVLSYFLGDALIEWVYQVEANNDEIIRRLKALPEPIKGQHLEQQAEADLRYLFS